MAIRYLIILNISLILASIYCAYSYTHIDNSNKQKHINYILAIDLMYNLMCISMSNIKIWYIMSSLASLILITWINNYKVIKSRYKLYVNVFYVVNTFLLVHIIINKNINFYILAISIILTYVNLCFNLNGLHIKNKLITIISMTIFTLTIITNIKIIYVYSYIVTIGININILTNILHKNIYKVSIKEKEVYGDLKTIDSNVKIKLEKLKNTKVITNNILENLKQKQQLLDIILNQSNKCVLIVDKDGYISNEDDSFINIWNEYKDYKYKIKLSYFLENSIENNIEVLLDIQKVYDLGIEVKGDIISKDGRYFECNYAPFKINRHSIGVVCVITDITYKKQSQLQINENQAKYKKIVETIPYSILMTNDFQITYSNNKNTDMDIYSQELKVLIMDTQNSDQITHLDKNGIEKNIVINKTSFLENNEVKNIVILRDVTKYTELLEKIQNSRIKYESLVNSIPEGIYMCNMEDENCIYANEKLLDIVGAKTLNEINRSCIKNKISLSLSNYDEVAKFTRHKIKTNYGSEVYVEVASITMEINNVLKGIGIIRDVTDQVKAENIEKEIRIKKLENKQKNDFFVNMSHELKTPLNLITSTNQLVQSVYKDELINNPKGELARVTNIVKKQGYISLGLIENIITLTKLESDFYESSLDCYDIVSVVEDIVIELNKYVREKDIEIIFDTYTEEKVINIDPYDIEKILLAVFSKVIKEANKSSVIYVYISDENDNINIFIENKGGHNKNVSLSKQSRESLQLNIEVAKSIIKLYNGSIDILDNKDDINIEINMKVNSKVDYYNKKDRILNSESIYAEYARINVL